MDVSGLQAPQRQQPRRQSLSTPPDAPLASRRPPSPLRNGYIPDSSSGSQTVDFHSIEGSQEWPMRSPSPSSSVSQQFATFTQRVLGGISTPASPRPMPTDAELEAEAERERDRSRREAELILMQEAKERKLVEERVLEMMENTRGLPPPPSRPQAMPPSPSNSQKEAMSWWTNAKNKLTPTKDLTPAQQVIQDTKTREKEKERERKTSKTKEKDRPGNSRLSSDGNPAFFNLQTPHQIPRRPVPTSPASPTPASALPPNLTPSPLRSIEASPAGKDNLPLYATFDPQGTLDVPTTLLTIAKRFEKLEKWTVGHVRALEDRMSDVERWLVDKEKDGEGVKPTKVAEPASSEALTDIREEVSELQSRMGELGREMARIATAPANLSAGPSRQSAEVSSAPQTSSSIVEHDNFPVMSPSPSHESLSFLARTPSKDRFAPSTARQSTSPPVNSKHPSSTRLPYPSGDYASPPPESRSQPGSPEAIEKTKPIVIPGLPEPSSNNGLTVSSASSSYSVASFSSASSISPTGRTPRGSSPNMYTDSPTSQPLRPLPSPGRKGRLSSVSPSPSPTPKNRKRYTVALGGPIVAPESDVEDENGGADGDGEDDMAGEETIGKKSSLVLTKSLSSASDNDLFSSNRAQSSPRARAQSTYVGNGASPVQAPTLPLNPNRIRSRSSERLGEKPSNPDSKFVDPLVLRRQREVSNRVGGSKGGKIGDLVKFFDKGNSK